MQPTPKPRPTSAVALLATALLASSLAACRAAPSTAPSPARGGRTTRSVHGTSSDCGGARTAVAITRARTPRRTTHTARPASGDGALVVRLLAVDSAAPRPSGPVRLVPAGPGEARQLRLEPAGDVAVARSGPLPAGRYVVEAAGKGFESRRFTVAVRPGATDTVRFRLAAACNARRTD